MSDDFDLDELGGFGLDDDDLGYDPFDPQVEETSNDRNPITAAPKSFVEGVTQTLPSRQFLEKVATDGLPPGYAKAKDVVDEGTALADELYNKAQEDLRPEMQRFKRNLKKNLNRIGGILPETIYNKLDSALSEDEGYGSSSENPDELAITSTLADIFKAQTEIQQAEKVEEQGDKVVERQVENAKFDTQTSQLVNIQDALSRMVGYQDDILSNYQKKSLELQFRHYFAARDLLELQKGASSDIVSALNGILKNTGLPDWLKSEQSEDFQEQLQQRLQGGMVEKVGDYVDNFRENLFGNIRNKVQEGVDMTKDTLSSINDMVEMYADMQDMEGGGEAPTTESVGTSIAEYLGELGANQATKKFGEWYAKKQYEFLMNNDTARQLNYKLLANTTNMPALINEYMKSDTDSDKWYKKLAEMVVPTSDGVEDKFVDTLSDKASSFVQWDVMSRKSLVEIIPGYLSRILQQLESMRTGVDTDRVIYDTETQSFTTVSEAQERFDAKLDKELDKESLYDGLMKAVDKLDKKNELDGEARLAVQEAMLAKIRKNEGFTIESFLDDTTYDGIINDPDLLADVLRGIKANVAYDKKGEIASSGSKGERNDKMTYRVNRVLQELYQELPQMQEQLQRAELMGQRELALGSKYAVRDNKSGQWSFDSESKNQDVAESLRRASRQRDVEQAFGEGGGDAETEAPDVSRGFTMPVDGVITSEYGRRDNPVTGESEKHHGIDIGVEEGTPVNPSSGGRIVSMANDEVFGKYAVIKHGNKLYTHYGHLSEFNPNLEIGDDVSAEDVIGYSGNTGRSTGPHLHFSVKEGPGISDVAMDPLAVMDNSMPTGMGGGDAPLEPVEGEREVRDPKRPLGIRDILLESRDIQDDILYHIESGEGGLGGMPSELAQKLADSIDRLSAGGIFGKAIDSVKSVGGKYIDFVSNIYGSAFGMAGKAANMVKDLAGRGWDAISGAFASDDLYVVGNPIPVLLGKNFPMGLYIDVATGETLESIDDVKGPVMSSETGQVLLSEEDIAKGVHRGTGKAILGGLTNALREGGKRAWGLVSGFYGGMGSFATGVFETGRDFIKSLDARLRTMSDVYVGGEDYPALLANKLRKGLYVDANGKPIFSVDDIVSDIFDENGNMVLSLEDVRLKGLFDSKGKKYQVSGLLGTAFGLGAKLTSGAWKMVRGAGNKIADLYKSALDSGTSLWDSFTDMFKGTTLEGELQLETLKVELVSRDGIKPVIDFSGLNLNDADFDDMPETVAPEQAQEAGAVAIHESTELLAVVTNIYNLLDKRVPEGGFKNDSDGDGVRDGSWKDQLANEEQETVAKKAKGKKKLTAGGALAAAVAAGTGEVVEAADDGMGAGDMLDMASDAKDLLSGGDDDGPDTKTRRRGPGRKTGKLGKLKNWGGKIFDKFGGKAVKKFGTKVASKLGTKALLAGAGALAGGTLLAPAIAAAGAAYTLYEVGSWVADYVGDRSDADPMEAWRFTQYGLDAQNEEHRIAIRRLEEFCDGEFQGDKGKAILKLSPEDVLEEVGDSFGLSEDMQNERSNWVIWFVRRFAPVASGWYNVSAEYDVDWRDADDELDDEDKPAFIRKVRVGAEATPYQVTSSPFPGQAVAANGDAVYSEAEQLIAQVGGQATKVTSTASTDRSKEVVGTTAAATVATAAKATDKALKTPVKGPDRTKATIVKTAGLTTFASASRFDGFMDDAPEPLTPEMSEHMGVPAGKVVLSDQGVNLTQYSTQAKESADFVNYVESRAPELAEDSPTFRKMLADNIHKSEQQTTAAKINERRVKLQQDEMSKKHLEVTERIETTLLASLQVQRSIEKVLRGIYDEVKDGNSEKGNRKQEKVIQPPKPEEPPKPIDPRTLLAQQKAKPVPVPMRTM